MAGLTLPGPSTGSRREPGPTSPDGTRPRPQTTHFPPFSQWLPSFLRDELRPYPGRNLLILRYTAAATLTMLAIVTFRLPGAAVGGFFCLLLPRESPRATLKSGIALLTSFSTALAFVLLGALLFVDYPLTHFLWVAGSFFLGFFALSVLSNYAAASAFAILIVIAVPQWDEPLPTALIVAQNLWVAGAVALAIACTLLVESLFALFKTTDALESALAERLAALADLFSHPGSPPAREKTQQLATVGVSRLRRLALAANTSDSEIARLSTAVALTGRLIDLSAALESIPESALARARDLGDELHRLLPLLTRPETAPAPPAERPSADDLPLLLELETTTETLRLTLARQSADTAVDTVHPKAPPFFVPDAFSNPEHLRFGLRGALAAFLCYVVMNAVSWPGLSTALFTCVVTALTSVGSSRQKQLLRIAGALTGSVLIGLIGQILILPMLDTVAGFAVYFVLVLLFSSWFITASPRLSYFGIQIALGFFLVNLNTPFPQTSLVVSRNNIAGILLGLFVMGIVFDGLGNRPAAVVMTDLFGTNLTLMARLATPWPRGEAADLAEIRTLREKISQNFSAVNAQADAILFETGRSRQSSLATRSVLLSAQPLLRTLFLLEVATLQYRIPIAPRDLPPSILDAQIRVDSALRQSFQQLAAALKSRSGPRSLAPVSLDEVRSAYTALEHSIATAYGSNPTPRSRAILTLLAHLIAGLSRLSTALAALPAPTP